MLDIDYSKHLEAAASIARDAAADGRVASYIPELAKADPSHFGLALAALDGTRCHVGEAEVPFTFQSVSKVFSLALAFRHIGLGALENMSCEPSGDAFHSIVRLEEEKGRPRNPYINAGAILVSSRLPGKSSAEKVRGLQAFLGEICDSATFPIDDRVYRSEAATGYRNRALANYMRHFGLLDDPSVAVDTYFRQCSISLDAVKLARLGLFLANKGVDPVSGRRIVDERCNRTVVAQMAMSGLYDEVGHFATTVGLPAKSGVSGAILAIVPNRMAIAAYGPALGSKGNSIAGMAALTYLSETLDLSLWQ